MIGWQGKKNTYNPTNASRLYVYSAFFESLQEYRFHWHTHIHPSSTSDSKICYTAYNGMYIVFLLGNLWNHLSLHKYSHCVPVTSVAIVL